MTDSRTPGRIVEATDSQTPQRQPLNARLRHKARWREALQAGEALLLPHAHERRLSNNHSRPPAATVDTTMMLHGDDDAGSSLGVVGAGFASEGSGGSCGSTGGDVLVGVCETFLAVGASDSATSIALAIS